MSRRPMETTSPTRAPAPQPAYAVGETLWFTKSMRMVEVARIDRYDHRDGWLYIVKRVDSGGELVATERGLAPLDSHPNE
jgi:hypothetical protein